MGYTVSLSLTRARPLEDDELDRLNEHVARQQQAHWPEPYRPNLTAGQPDAGLTLEARMKVGYEPDVVDRFLTALTELRGLFPDAACTVDDDLGLVHWNGDRFAQRGATGATAAPAITDAGAAVPTGRGASRREPSEKVVLTKVARDPKLMYYVDTAGVWAVRRQPPGAERTAPVLIVEVAIEMDRERYIYLLDSDGDIARKLRGP